MAKSKQGSKKHRLVVVTNREPFQFVSMDGESPKWERAPGGLVSALEPALSKLGGVWISSAPQQPHVAHDGCPFDWRSIRHDPQAYADFYSGFSNGVLWPLLHSLIHSSLKFEREEWDAYQQINANFADECRRIMKQDDLIWVHDYQLSLVPQLLRQQQMTKGARIGYFLHVPFPGYDVFRALPWARELLLGLLGADVIAFHIPEYVSHFFDAAELLLGLKCDREANLIVHEGRAIRVRAMPIGIDAEGITKIGSLHSVQRKVKELQTQAQHSNIIIGIDRLDYTKGLLRKLQAVELFFERYPHRRGQVSLIQLAVPTRTDIGEYQKLREDIEQAVGHINGLYAKPGWTPVTYMCRSLPFHDLVALYQSAQIALVTPLRDGMNLVAKEYVAARKGKGGALILSELAGAAKEMREAILVNPYDVDAIADSIEFALNMKASEQHRRMTALSTQVFRHDVHTWIQNFLKEAVKSS